MPSDDARPRVSIIVPTRNEAPGLEAVLAAAAEPAPWELIVVDGGSDDATVQVARQRRAIVIASSPGRGVQLHTGAMAATGDVLLFLHADTLLPDGYHRNVEHLMSTPAIAVGAFGLRIEGGGRALRLVEAAVNWRARVLRMPYGDQALFMRAAIYRDVGGFPPWAAMEDYDLIRRLRRLGRVSIAPASVVTSSRRWKEQGVWRTTLLNQFHVLAHRCGVSGDRIGAWRSRTSNGDLPARSTVDTVSIR